MRRVSRQALPLLAAVAAVVLCLSAAAEPDAETPVSPLKSEVGMMNEEGLHHSSFALHTSESEAPSDTQEAQGQKKLEKELENETARLRRLKAELETLEAAALPGGAPQADGSGSGEQASQENSPTGPTTQRRTDREADAREALRIPDAPAPGAEEEFANALFALGRYDRATAVYRRIIEGEADAEKEAWALLQLGNCQRRSGDVVGALKAYGQLIADSPDSFWAEEAAWWSGQIKWRLLWNETLRPGVAVRSSAASPAEGP